MGPNPAMNRVVIVAFGTLSSRFSARLMAGFAGSFALFEPRKEVKKRSSLFGKFGSWGSLTWWAKCDSSRGPVSNRRAVRILRKVFVSKCPFACRPEECLRPRVFRIAFSGPAAFGLPQGRLGAGGLVSRDEMLHV